MGATHIGDILYNTASLRFLAERLPECKWYYFVTPPASQVLANNPFLAGCIDSLDALDSLDVAICYNSGGYWRELLEISRRGLANRVAYVHKGFSGLVTHEISINFPQLFPAYFRDLVSQLTGLTPTWSLRPEVFTIDRDVERAQSLWEELELDGTRPVLACFATSRQSLGVWPSKNFGAAIRQVEGARDIQTVLLGAPEDLSVLTDLKNAFGLRARVAAGKLELLELVAFLRRCTSVFSTDSGPRHLANAAGVQVTYIRNISFSHVEAGRYCETELDLAPQVEFVPAAKQAEVFSALDPVEIGNRVTAAVRDSWERNLAS
ncbi:MAG: hypothetical protein H0X40_07045 [Chthoniobacterales bacterium]|nr:hypothetical protein [Chthoniobacterales bacterium]